MPRGSTCAAPGARGANRRPARGQPREQLLQRDPFVNGAAQLCRVRASPRSPSCSFLGKAAVVEDCPEPASLHGADLKGATQISKRADRTEDSGGYELQ